MYDGSRPELHRALEEERTVTLTVREMKHIETLMWLEVGYSSPSERYKEAAPKEIIKKLQDARIERQ